MQIYIHACKTCRIFTITRIKISVYRSHRCHGFLELKHIFYIHLIILAVLFYAFLSNPLEAGVMRSELKIQYMGAL